MRPTTTVRGMSDGISKTLTISTHDGEIVIPESQFAHFKQIFDTWSECGYMPESWLCIHETEQESDTRNDVGFINGWN